MSTLTLTLILLVAATLAAVAGANLLQSRRGRPPRRMPGTGGATEPARSEPSLAFESASADDVGSVAAESDTAAGEMSVTAPSASTERVPGDVPAPHPPDAESPVPVDDRAAVLRPTGTAPTGPEAPDPTPVPAPRAAVPGTPRTVLSDIADCIVELGLPNPQSGERLLALTQSFRRVGAKPIVFEGRVREAAGESAEWTPLAAGPTYARLRAGVLLANRHGPLNAMEYSEFSSGLHNLSEHLGTPAEPSDMPQVLERARELDGLCIQLDAQVGVNVDCAQPLIPADLARVAIEHELVERGNNRYARLNGQAQVLFSVALADEPNRLTFLLDVPRAPMADRPWDALVAAAQAIADRLQGTLVDDLGRPLAPASLARIGQQIAQRYESLEQAGFPAGSPLALRLFN